MTELVHKLNLLEHVIAVGPVLVQFQDHHFMTRLVSDLEITRKCTIKSQTLDFKLELRR